MIFEKHDAQYNGKIKYRTKTTGLFDKCDTDRKYGNDDYEPYLLKSMESKVEDFISESSLNYSS